MRDAGPDRRVELRAAQVRRRAGPGRTELQLSGIRLHVGDEFRERRGGEIFATALYRGLR